MDFVTYIKKAERTSAKLADEKLDNQHYILGLVTEIGELADIFKKELAYKKEADMVNAQEEIGDFCWYLANLVRANNISTEHLFEHTDPSPIGNIGRVIELSGIISWVQNALVYKDVHPEILERNVVYLTENLLAFCRNNDFDITKIWDTNIAKLQARYPEKFTEEDALNRDLAKERQILENN